MTLPTNVPSVTFGPNGFIVPTDSAILAGVQADINAAFGGNLNPGLTTPQGQLATSQAACVSNADQTFLFFTTQVDPAYAEGRMQDAIARIYFLERLPAEPTVLQIMSTGLVGLTIPVNALIQDTSGNVYTCTAAGTIPSSGNITLPFANLLPGPIAVPTEDNVSIYQSIPGWDTVVCSSGVLGQNVETRSAFEARREASVAQNSVGSLPSIKGAVLSVPGVLDCYATENDTNSPLTIGGVTLNANSIYVGVVGGESAAIAQAIWSKKAPGCSYNGNTSVTVYDTNSGYSPPYPSYTVLFEIPLSLQILFAVEIFNTTLVPSNATQLIQNAIINAFAGGDGGPRAAMGATILATRFVAPIAALGSWAQIVSIGVGSTNAYSAQFTGAVSGTTLTVSSVTGTIAIGQTLTDATGALIPGTTITAGSGTSWTVSNSQTVTSELMVTAVADNNSVVVEIAQEPVLVAANIIVTLS